MTKKPIERLRRYYDRLSVVERVNLVMDAQDRDDLGEVDVLERACPVRQSFEYEGRVLALAHAATALVVQLLACDALIAARLPDLDTDPGAEALPALRSLLARQSALWHGFAAWCRDLGHDPRQVLRLAPIGPDNRDPAYFLVHTQLALIESGAAGVPVLDPEQIQSWRDTFARTFGHLENARLY